METKLVHDLAQELYDAEWRSTSTAPITERYPDASPWDAYAIQNAWATLRTGAGARQVGRKIGATSEAIQRLFSIDTPDYGRIFDDMMVDNGGTIARGGLILPMTEPELAFVLDRDLGGPGVTRDDVLTAIKQVFPCIEVIDSRIDDWRIRFVDTVADNGSSARCVLGDPIAFDGLDLAAVKGTLRKNGQVVAEATGAAVLGHPAEAVAWLANMLGTFGGGLRAGEYVLSGSFTTADRAERGDSYSATFDGVGTVSCHFA
jgi:2-keto-4-pentenoate hydratase